MSKLSQIDTQITKKTKSVEEDGTVVYTLMQNTSAVSNSAFMHDARPGSVFVAVFPAPHFLFC